MSDSAETIQQEAEAAWCAPVSADAFCGAPSRYDDDYDKLLTEIAKLESAHGLEVDWKEVYRCADVLLREKTKDMAVLGPLCIAAIKTKGFGGLARGLHAYAWLIENHSKHMFPKAARKRGRGGALSWMTQHLERELESASASVDEHSAVVVCQEAFEKLDGLLREELDTHYPRTGPIKARWEALVSESRGEPEPEPETETETETEPEPETETETETEPEPETETETEPKPEPVQPEPPPPPPPPKPAIPERIDDAEAADSALGMVHQLLRLLAQYHLAVDDANALGYQLAHMASFLRVVPGGQQGVNSTSPRRLAELKEADDQGQWTEILQLLPQLFADDELSVNAEFYVMRALAELGSRYRPALDTVTGHALGVYMQLGEQAGALAEPAAWLTSLVDVANRPDSEAPNPENQDAPNPVKQAIEEAHKEGRRRGLDAGCSLLQTALTTAGDPQQRFRLRHAIAQLCVQLDAPELGQPILDELSAQLQQPVAAWEPQLVADVTRTALTSARLLRERADDEDEKQRLATQIRELLNTLSKVDMSAALEERSK